MPDWNSLVPEGWSALQLIGWIVAAGLLIALVVKLWPFVTNAVAIIDALVKLPGALARVEKLTGQVSEIHHETHRNDGSSIKDSTVRLEEAVERVESSLSGVHGRLDTVETDTAAMRTQVDQMTGQIDQLASMDDRLWEEIERTQNPDEGENDE